MKKVENGKQPEHCLRHSKKKTNSSCVLISYRAIWDTLYERLISRKSFKRANN